MNLFPAGHWYREVFADVSINRVRLRRVSMLKLGRWGGRSFLRPPLLTRLLSNRGCLLRADRPQCRRRTRCHVDRRLINIGPAATATAAAAAAVAASCWPGCWLWPAVGAAFDSAPRCY